MRLLLDTHALLWYLGGDARLPSPARLAIDDPERAAFVSAASAWEIATKTRLGKLAGGRLAADFVATARAEGFRVISVNAQDAQDAGNLRPPQDPFDRMLVAQALHRGLVLVSNEAAFDPYGVTRLWA